MQKPFFLRCEHLENPVSISYSAPRLSWKNSVSQSAWQVLVASSADELAQDKGGLWDSGKVEDDRQLNISYEGRLLSSRQSCWWKVRIWDDAGQVSEWSDSAYWQMGLLSRSDWSAQWIAGLRCGGKRIPAPSPLLRKEFCVERPLRSARLYISALGLYECSINGMPVSMDLLRPGWTDYTKRVQYQVLDVAPLLSEGANALGVVLGDGWYCGQISWFERQQYGTRPACIAQLEITYPDGTVQSVVSDDSWKTTFGPIVAADLMMGQHEDARLKIPGWDSAGFDDSSWAAVEKIKPSDLELSPEVAPPVREIQSLAPVDIQRLPDEVGVARWVLDFGQNLVGTLRVKIEGQSGETLEIRHAEVLNKDGTLYTNNLRGAAQKDLYVLRGDVGGENFFPRFTFHGFRYAEISVRPARVAQRCVLGTPAPSPIIWAPSAENTEAVVFHSDLAVTGTFSCSDPWINKLQSNIQWGQKGNFVDVPTDCPQRDERLGWTGDAQVFCATAAFNMDVCGFFRKWMRDMRDGQLGNGDFPKVAPNVLDFAEPDDLACCGGGPAWSDAGIIVPWTIYERYGDTRILEENYDAMVRFLEFLIRKSPGLIHPPEGFGDWLSTDGPTPMLALTPKDLIGTAFLVHDARLLSRIAAVLGKKDDAVRFDALFSETREKFVARYVTAEGLIADHTQTAYLLALHFDLLPESSRALAVQALVEDINQRGGKLSTGFVGTPYLNPVLSANGRHDTAFALLFQKQWPSWLYSIVHGDATTIWERWDGWTHDRGFQDPSMNSFNHYAYGAIGQWLYETVAGLAPSSCENGVAYRKLKIAPTPGGGILSASATLETLFGTASSSWKIEDAEFSLVADVPIGCSAEIVLPSGATFAAGPGRHEYAEPISEKS